MLGNIELNKLRHPTVLNSPSPQMPLRDRLVWTSADPESRTEQDRIQRIARTDYIHSSLLPRMAKRGLDLQLQLLLIHHAHMKRNEHLLLDANQARFLTSFHKIDISSLAGVIRSTQSLRLNGGLGVGIRSPHFADVPVLLDTLCEKAEELFPWGRKNELVTDQSIYFFISAFQYFVALTHPFAEANGRTSEDFTYCLWERRPDLKRLKRYVSNNGDRNTRDVYIRLKLIDKLALRHMHQIGIQIAKEMGIRLKITPTTNYDTILILIEDHGGDRDLFNDRYSQLIAEKIKNLIANVDSPQFEEESPKDFADFIHLAKHLEACSPGYQLNSH